MTVDLWWSALGVAAAAAVTVLPTMLLALVYFDEPELAVWERLCLGLGLALVLPPLLLFLELQLAGLAFSRALVLANAALVALAALGLARRRTPAAPAPIPAFVPEAVLAVMLVAFGLRFASASPTFYETDPYFYTKVTERLLRDGVVATLSPEAYAPRQLFLRVPPLMHYCTAAWFAVYESVAGAALTKEAIVRTAQLMPPLAGALVAFLGFLLARTAYGHRVGVGVAVILGALPQLVERFAAGRSEQQPYGLFAVMLTWALYALALERSTPRLVAATAVAAGASVLASQHHIAALVVVAAHAGAQALVDYARGVPDRRVLAASGATLAGVLAASALYAAYTGGYRFRFLAAPQLVLAASFALVAILHAGARRLRSGRARLLGALGLAVVAAAAWIATPLGPVVGALLPGLSGGALVRSAVALTILEEQPARTPFGALPLVLPLCVAMTAIACAIGALLRGRRALAIAVAAGSIAAVALANPLRRALGAVAGHGDPALREALGVLAGSPVWIYLLAAVAAVAIDQLGGARSARARLFLPFIAFALAYPGLEQLKFTPHLGIALALAVGIVLGEFGRASDALRASAWSARVRWPLRAAAAVLCLGGVVVVLAAAVTLPRALGAIAAARIPPEWVTLRELEPPFEAEPKSAMGWLHRHLNRLDPAAQARCRERVGSDCRVLAWWDYGHWITFFGEANAVLDPTNQFHDYVHETARALVERPPALERAMRLHGATHVLLSVEMIDRWSSISYLAGSCVRAHSELCPDEPDVDWRAGRGRSRYEKEHAYEFLTATGPACDLRDREGAGRVMRSTTGARYCAGNSALRPLDADIRAAGAERRVVRALTPILAAPPDREVSYLVRARRAESFVNLNPDLRPAGLESRVFDSAFTQLYFFEQLPGFRLVFRSPEATVKIFERVR